MDKNSIIGFSLIALILVTYGYFQQPTPEEMAAQKQQAISDSIAALQAIDTANVASYNNEVETALAVNSNGEVTGDSVLIAAENLLLKQQFGTFSAAAKGEEELIAIDNEKFTITFSNKGGRIADVVLKEHKTYEQTDLHLFEKETAEQFYTFTSEGKNIRTDLLFLEPTITGNTSVTGEEKTTITFKAATNNPNNYLQFTYTITGNDYMVDFNIAQVNLQGIISSPLTLHWKNIGLSNEKNPVMEKQRCSVFYKYLNDDRDYLSESGDDEEALEGKLHWVAFKQNFFSSILISEIGIGGANKGVMRITPIEDSAYTKAFETEVELAGATTNLKWFFGPNHYQTLRNYEIDQLDRIIDFGWGIFGWVNKYFIVWIFYWLKDLAISYGVIILIITVLIKLLLFPLTYKNYVSSAKMRVLKPEIDALNEKHKNSDAMKKQQATMALYKQTGVNPMAGCIPMVIQMPILYAMFRFFPASIELRQQPFLWADDLSSYDSIMDLSFSIPFYGDHVSLFTLLMAVSTIGYTYINSSNMSMPQQPGMPNMKVMMYMFPVMMLFFFNGYSSGLSYYYLLANMISIAQMIIIKKYIVDEGKLLAKLEKNKESRKGQKKSKWQARLEDMAKQQQNKKK